MSEGRKRGTPRRVNHERVVELYEKGLTKDVIAMRCGCSERHVLRIVATEGKPRPRDMSRAGKPREVDHRRVVELHRRGVPMEAIAARVGCTKRYVSRIVAKEGK